MSDESVMLEIQDLVVDFELEADTLRAVDSVSLTVHEGEAVAIVGESGSGKSVTALAVMGLLANPPAQIRSGRILYRGVNLFGLDKGRRRAVNGREIAMIYQDSMASLNPSLTIGQQLIQVVRYHTRVSHTAAAARARELLDLVGISDASSRLSDYPHQFSGGQRQRALIALALSCSPKVLIADEATTALDVTVQAQIVELVIELRERLGMAVIWITHDLGVVANLVDRVAVMYAGRIVEQAPVRELFASPQHPYTIGLLDSLPQLSGDLDRLRPIPGGLPDMVGSIDHCAFAPRCPRATDRCRTEVPILQIRRVGAVACFYPGSIERLEIPT